MKEACEQMKLDFIPWAIDLSSVYNLQKLNSKETAKRTRKDELKFGTMEVSNREMYILLSGREENLRPHENGGADMYLSELVYR